MAEFEASRGMPALGEIVFAQASGLDLWGKPPVQRSERPDDSTLRLNWGQGQEGSGRMGRLEVVDSGAGACKVTLHMDLPDGDALLQNPEAVHQAFEEFLERLQRTVLQRVNDAS